MSKVSMTGTVTCQDGKQNEMEAAFGPLMAAPPKMSVSTPIAALGFDV